MRAPFLAFVAALFLVAAPVQAQTDRVYSQPELDALLAPIALYPDALLDQILDAATHPAELAEAAAWSRVNPGLSGEAAVAAVQDRRWHASVKALVAYPDLLARMADSPHWVRDLGDAFLMQQAAVMDTVQLLRSRAHAAGSLRSDATHYVGLHGETIVIRPPRPQVVYVPYYDPLVVYGTWWWATHRPVHWRPWATRVVVVQPHAHRPRPHVRHHDARAGFRTHAPRSGVVHERVPESRRQPIVQSTTVRPPVARSAPPRAHRSATPPERSRGFRAQNFVPR
jgi:hypothetical protein